VEVKRLTPGMFFEHGFEIAHEFEDRLVLQKRFSFGSLKGTLHSFRLP
jgi:hypothetical protein